MRFSSPCDRPRARFRGEAVLDTLQDYIDAFSWSRILQAIARTLGLFQFLRALFPTPQHTVRDVAVASQPAEGPGFLQLQRQHRFHSPAEICEYLGWGLEVHGLELHLIAAWSYQGVKIFLVLSLVCSTCSQSISRAWCLRCVSLFSLYKMRNDRISNSGLPSVKFSSNFGPL